MTAIRRLLMTVGAMSSLACGSTSGPVLERIEPQTPPRSRARIDVLLVNDVTSCAIGRVCTRTEESCFALTRAGSTLYFEPNGLAFVAPGDPRVEDAEQSGCFRLALDMRSREEITQAVQDVRARAFRLSGGTIDLDLKLHELPAVFAGFKRWEGGRGVFLEPHALEEEALRLVRTDTDYVVSITGETNPELGFLPTIEPCGGTNWQEQGGFGGAAYTWLSLRCATGDSFLWHLLQQTYFALRDVMYFDDLYAQRYPACEQGDLDPQRWFPRPGDCEVDPDFSGCSDPRCRFDDAFMAHIFTAHWPSDGKLVGNHCRNGVRDFDESSVDQGGVCERIGR